MVGRYPDGNDDGEEPKHVERKHHILEVGQMFGQYRVEYDGEADGRYRQQCAVPPLEIIVGVVESDQALCYQPDAQGRAGKIYLPPYCDEPADRVAK